MGKKVYIVDDDVELVEAMRLCLEDDGFEVKAQYETAKLVENIRRFSPSVILLDVMFPDDQEAGFKMARLIRSQEDLSKIPILMLTGVNREGNLPVKFNNDDCDDSFLPVTEFLEKPVDSPVLVQKVRQLTR